MLRGYGLLSGGVDPGEDASQPIDPRGGEGRQVHHQHVGEVFQQDRVRRPLISDEFV